MIMQGSTPELEVTSEKSFKQLCRLFLTQSNMVYRQKQSNRSIKALRRIEQKQKIAEIRFKYFIHSSMQILTQQSPLIQYMNILSTQAHSKKSTTSAEDQELISILNVLQAQDKNFYLIIYLIEKRYLNLINPDKEVENVHNHYINDLPKDYSYHPSNFAKDIEPYHQQISKSLKEFNLRIEKLTENCFKLMTNMFYSSTFKQFLASLKSEQLYNQYLLSFTSDKISWGAHVCQTRIFTRGLVPFLDLFNHSNFGDNATWHFDNEMKIVSLVASKTIKKDGQIFVSYGSRTMQDLFQTYGFLQLRDSCNYCQIEIPIGLSTFQKNLKIQATTGYKFAHLKKKLLKSWFQFHSQQLPTQKHISNFTSFIASCEAEIALRKKRKRLQNRSIANVFFWEVERSVNSIISQEIKLIQQIIKYKQILLWSIQASNSKK